MLGNLMKAVGICKSYHKKNVLRDITFSLQPGDVLGLFGPNGSGKSTLLDIIALAAKPSSGTLLIEGVDAISNANSFRPNIGYVPQDIALFEELTVKENLLCWSRLPGKEAKRKAKDLAEKLNLSEIYHQKISTLSGGMRRRVNLAVALLGKPTLLVLDELYSGVDTENIKIIQETLASMAQNGVSQIISGHSPEMILPYATHVMMLSHGEISFYGDRDAYLLQTCESSSIIAKDIEIQDDIL